MNWSRVDRPHHDHKQTTTPRAWVNHEHKHTGSTSHTTWSRANHKYITHTTNTLNTPRSVTLTVSKSHDHATSKPRSHHTHHEHEYTITTSTPRSCHTYHAPCRSCGWRHEHEHEHITIMPHTLRARANDEHDHAASTPHTHTRTHTHLFFLSDFFLCPPVSQSPKPSMRQPKSAWSNGCWYTTHTTPVIHDTSTGTPRAHKDTTSANKPQVRAHHEHTTSTPSSSQARAHH